MYARYQHLTPAHQPRAALRWYQGGTKPYPEATLLTWSHCSTA